METKPDKTEVVVTDINMPFSSMVGFMIKWGIATIPAAIIFMGIMFVVAGVLAGFLRAFFPIFE